METHMRLRQLPWIQSSLPFIGMVTAVVALALNTIISKMAMSEGTSFYVLCVYSNGLATVLLFPAAFLFHRSKRPPLTFSVLWRIFLLASFGCFAELGGNAGLKDSSPTLATAMSNIVPAFTYILAIVFRLEELNWRRLSSICKSVGTVVSIAGAFIVTFYNGPAILNKPLNSESHVQLNLSSQQNWILGGFLLAFSCFLTALWCILQAFILKMYPAEMIVIAFYCFFVTIQSSLVSVVAERDVSAWRIEAKMGLVAVLYSAIINIAYRLYVTAWCLSRTGPLFVSLFKPLTILVAVVITVIFMKDVLYFGSLVGAIVVIIGFYCVMWGKAKEGGVNKGIESSNREVLLLQETEDV
ncbi:Glucose-6-phosphate/phosphate and phosphoenolpyruvate/phosphate antiporter [Handroanthus impetiginosus]|uniref:WAT1-related protein n=1 Tax=Handroanthus impetiginosus TaxID=429701 RepID=A0A2G9GXY9_9LAMI|nr:Glucose-6-phosphate/phosphate and phosphoenolpyruvate/phosphate antiporter [Handroanthus impetiginosus]